MTLSFFIATGAAFFGASSVHREGLYDVYIIAIVLLYSLCLVVLTAIIFKILTVFERTISFNDKLISSILLSLFLIFFYHFFLSTWIEKQGIINSYKKELNQLNYELYEPTYIPVGHNLFEARVDSGDLSFYYRGNEGGLFVISEFKKTQMIDLAPPDCYIEGDHLMVLDGSGSVTNYIRGNCKEIKTPKGTPVYLIIRSEEGSEEKLAVFILGNTLITINQNNFSDQELMNLIDGLEEKDASDINFRVADSTIGR